MNSGFLDGAVRPTEMATTAAWRRHLLATPLAAAARDRQWHNTGRPRGHLSSATNDVANDRDPERAVISDEIEDLISSFVIFLFCSCQQIDQCGNVTEHLTSEFQDVSLACMMKPLALHLCSQHD